MPLMESLSYYFTLYALLIGSAAILLLGEYLISTSGEEADE